MTEFSLKARLKRLKQRTRGLLGADISLQAQIFSVRPIYVLQFFFLAELFFLAFWATDSKLSASRISQ